MDTFFFSQAHSSSRLPMAAHDNCNSPVSQRSELDLWKEDMQLVTLGMCCFLAARDDLSYCRWAPGAGGRHAWLLTVLSAEMFSTNNPHGEFLHCLWDPFKHHIFLQTLLTMLHLAFSQHSCFASSLLLFALPFPQTIYQLLTQIKLFIIGDIGS